MGALKRLNSKAVHPSMPAARLRLPCAAARRCAPRRKAHCCDSHRGTNSCTDFRNRINLQRFPVPYCLPLPNDWEICCTRVATSCLSNGWMNCSTSFVRSKLFSSLFDPPGPGWLASPIRAPCFQSKCCCRNGMKGMNGSQRWRSFVLWQAKPAATAEKFQEVIS